MNTQIHEYVKNNKGKKLGVLVAVRLKDSNIVRVGWSKVHTHKDKFDRDIGIRVAMGRATSGSVTPVPHSLNKRIDLFRQRTERYFKDCEANILQKTETPK